ncbi:MAG: chondroitinase-B domain-containing protein [Nonlabens sp.]
MFKYFLPLLLITLISCDEQQNSSQKTVSTPQELQVAIDSAQAGTTIVMKDGVWNNLVLKFHGNGTENEPIVLKPETPGGVSLEGQSVLKLSGEYLQVQDLYFKNGYTPDDAVIIFRNSPDSIAFNCSVTGTVIENYTQPDRHRKDHWVEFYGQHNELANSYITGKSNEGPTVKVYLNGNEHVNNYHKIHHNHFGPRPRKGGPKAETMQLGASTTSMTPSYTQVTDNLFEKCNGEVEIISSKSNFNSFSNNVFLESEGSVVTRHGNYVKIDGNLFKANGNPYVGGVRIINTGHTVTNNYFDGLKGQEFRAALAVMNGIPKSPLNRYNQVTDVVVAHNSWINCEQPIHFSVGVNLDQAEVLPPSEIRSARPKRVVFANNLVYNDFSKSYPIKAYDKIDGVKFQNNLMISKQTMNSDRDDFELLSIKEFKGKGSFYVSENDTELYSGFGFEKIDTDLFGNKRTEESNKVGAIVNPISETEAKATLNDENYGPSWFTTTDKEAEKTTITVSNADELMKAVETAKNGSTINLNAGNYALNEQLEINRKLILSGNEDSKVTVISNANSLFEMQPYGQLTLQNLEFAGDQSQNFIISDKGQKMYANYDLTLENVIIDGFNTVLEVAKGSFADEITLNNTTIKNCKNGLLLDQETDDKGDYNVEFLTITNSTFENVSNEIIDFYRGGYDESTIGGVLKLTNNTFLNCGQEDEDEILINTRGIVNVTFAHNTFKNNGTEVIAILWGAKGQKPENNTIINSGEIKVVENIALKLVY